MADLEFCKGGNLPMVRECPDCIDKYIDLAERYQAEVKRLNLQNVELLNLLRECHGFLSHSFACPESPDKFTDAVVDLAGRVNVALGDKRNHEKEA